MPLTLSSCSDSISIALIFGVPLNVPAGRAAFKQSTGVASSFFCPITLEAVDKKPGIFFLERHDAEFLQEVERLRTEGERVIQIFSANPIDHTEINCDRELVRENGHFAIKKLA